MLILASASPARLELLKNVGYTPDLIVPADIDETPLRNENPREYVKRIALNKAKKIKESYATDTIIAADTIAVRGARIIGKAADGTEAAKIIGLLSGSRHKVITGLVIISSSGQISQKSISTSISFKKLSVQEIEEYIATNAWVGKSGCFGLQGAASAFIKSINGSYSNVIGLPLYETCNILKTLGIKPQHSNLTEK
jgi:septum formation protein